jgi:hypothetical protein
VLVPDSSSDLSRRPPKIRFNRWLAIAVGLAVLMGAVLLDLSLLGRVQTLSALAADRQSQLTKLEKKNQELDTRLQDDDDTIRWLLRAP